MIKKCQPVWAAPWRLEQQSLSEQCPDFGRQGLRAHPDSLSYPRSVGCLSQPCHGLGGWRGDSRHQQIVCDWPARLPLKAGAQTPGFQRVASEFCPRSGPGGEGPLPLLRCSLPCPLFDFSLNSLGEPSELVSNSLLIVRFSGLLHFPVRLHSVSAFPTRRCSGRTGTVSALLPALSPVSGTQGTYRECFMNKYITVT